MSLNTFRKISNILCKQISVFAEHFQDVSWLHKKCTSLVQNVQHLNVKQIVHGLLISGNTPFFRPVFCKMCSFFYKKENINNINKIKSFLLEQIYSKLVSGFLSYNQFKVSQFLRVWAKKKLMFSGSVEVWDCIGEACADSAGPGICKDSGTWNKHLRGVQAPQWGYYQC